MKKINDIMSYRCFQFQRKMDCSAKKVSVSCMVKYTMNDELSSIRNIARTDEGSFLSSIADLKRARHEQYLAPSDFTAVNPACSVRTALAKV